MGAACALHNPGFVGRHGKYHRPAKIALIVFFNKLHGPPNDGQNFRVFRIVFLLGGDRLGRQANDQTDCRQSEGPESPQRAPVNEPCQ